MESSIRTHETTTTITTFPTANMTEEANNKRGRCCASNAVRFPFDWRTLVIALAVIGMVYAVMRFLVFVSIGNYDETDCYGFVMPAIVVIDLRTAGIYYGVLFAFHATKVLAAYRYSTCGMHSVVIVEVVAFVLGFFGYVIRNLFQVAWFVVDIVASSVLICQLSKGRTMIPGTADVASAADPPLDPEDPEHNIPPSEETKHESDEETENTEPPHKEIA